MTTDPIKALVERLKFETFEKPPWVMLRGGEVEQIIEALTPIAEGTSVVVPLYDLQKIILTIFNGDDPLDERNGARKSYDNLRSILSASPSASTGKDGDYYMSTDEDAEQESLEIDEFPLEDR